MTAEIAIINRQAIALAADSAVTVGKRRVWNHSNKLFSLGPDNDIAIMIYNSGDFVGFTWETIIKQFRAERVGKMYDSVSECATDFMSYLEDSRFVADKRNRVAYLSLFLEPLEFMFRSVPKQVTGAAFSAALDDICDRLIEKAVKLPELPNPPSYKEFLKTYKANIKSLSSSVFPKTPKASALEKITRTMYELWKYQNYSEYYTGIVVAGFGRRQFFPELLELCVDGKDDLWTRKWVSRHHDTNSDGARKTMIVPFGQADIFHLFMEGVSPEYIKFVGELLEKVLVEKSERLIESYVASPDRLVEIRLQQKDNRKIRQEFLKEFARYWTKEVVQPILEVVRTLPKEEMANMAEALVELTSLRRKVDSPLESVGGPVDVAVISKGDGLIWVKRKHYFDLAKNKDFLHRKFGKIGGSNDGSEAE